MYIPGHVGRWSDSTALGFMATMTGIFVIAAGAITTIFILRNNMSNDISKHIAKDINKKLEQEVKLDSFSATSITIDESAEKTLKFVGSAVDQNGTTFNFAQATYKFDGDQLSKLDKFEFDANNQKRESDYKFNFMFLKTILDILPQGELVDCAVENVNFTSNELVLSVGEPKIDVKNNVISYNLDLVKLQGSTLKHGTFNVSTTLSEDLKSNPKLIYGLDKKILNAKLLNIDTYKNVNYVKKTDDNLFVM